MSIKKEVGKYVSGQITILTANMKYSGGKAKLANLRRGIGKAPGELPELWGSFLNGIPDELLGTNGKPSRAEWAIYLSLTLFALHQQGNSDSVNAENISLGKAAARLMEKPNDDDERERVLRRLGPIVTAKDITAFNGSGTSKRIVFDSDSDGTIVQDVPVSFSQLHRIYGYRMKKEEMLLGPEHDPMAEL